LRRQGLSEIFGSVLADGGAGCWIFRSSWHVVRKNCVRQPVLTNRSKLPREFVLVGILALASPPSRRIYSSLVTFRSGRRLLCPRDRLKATPSASAYAVGAA